jgi:hypothetical protein
LEHEQNVTLIGLITAKRYGSNSAEKKKESQNDQIQSSEKQKEKKKKEIKWCVENRWQKGSTK